MQVGDEGGFWTIIAGLVIALGAAGTAIAALIRKIYCKGVNDQKEKDDSDTLKKQVNDLTSRLDELEDDIKVYRKETASQLKEVNDKLSSNGQDIAVIKTILQKNFPE